MSKLSKSYMAEEILLYKCLVEVCEYCKSRGFSIKLLENEDDKKVFRIDLSNDIYIEMSVGIVCNEYTQPHPIIDIELDPLSAHTKGTKKVADAIKKTGQVIGGGIGVIVSITTLGIGWILGTGITVVGSKIGKIPGVMVDKIDDFFTNNKLEKFQDDLSSIITIFKNRMIELCDFDVANVKIIDFCRRYSAAVGKNIGHVENKKKNLDFKFNSLQADKHTTKFYSTISPVATEMICELKNKVVEKSTIKIDEEIIVEFVCSYYSETVGKSYNEVILQKNNNDIVQTKEELIVELRNKLLTT